MRNAGLLVEHAETTSKRLQRHLTSNVNLIPFTPDYANEVLVRVSFWYEHRAQTQSLTVFKCRLEVFYLEATTKRQRVHQIR